MSEVHQRIREQVPGEQDARPRLTRRRRRQLVLTGEYAIFLAVIVLLFSVADWHQISDNFARGDIARELFPEIITVGLKKRF